MKTLWTWSRNKYEKSTIFSNSVWRKTWYIDERASSNFEKNYIHSRDSRPTRQREKERERNRAFTACMCHQPINENAKQIGIRY